MLHTMVCTTAMVVLTATNNAVKLLLRLLLVSILGSVIFHLCDIVHFTVNFIFSIFTILISDNEKQNC